MTNRTPSMAMSPEQAEALEALAPKLGPDAYLAGGVAVAARLQHRRSVDLDIFMDVTSPEQLVPALEEIHALRLLSRAEGTVHATIGPVPVSLLRYRYPLLAQSERLDGFSINVASLLDLIGMKLAAIAGRGAVRDFWDLHALLEATGLSLAEALELYRKKYPVEDLGHVAKSLVYFADADSEPLPGGLTIASWGHIKEAFVRRVMDLVPGSPSMT